jgi:hypothetical protein
MLLLALWGGVVVMVEVMMVLVDVGVGTLPESDSDLRVSFARRSFFSLAFSRPALQNSSNLELMSSSDLLAAPADGWLLGLSSMFSSSTSCNNRCPRLKGKEQSVSRSLTLNTSFPPYVKA